MFARPTHKKNLIRPDGKRVVFTTFTPPPFGDAPIVRLRPQTLKDIVSEFDLGKFQVPLPFGVGGVLDDSSVKNRTWSADSIIVSYGQLKVGLQIPLYDPEDPFFYEAMASSFPHRGVMQYLGNFYRILRDFKERSIGETTDPRSEPFDQEEYIMENFFGNYKSIQLNRRHTPPIWGVVITRIRSLADGAPKLLTDLDPQKLDNSLLRKTSDEGWYKIPIVIKGPWVYGYSEDGSYMEASLPEHSHFLAYAPWKFVCDNQLDSLPSKIPRSFPAGGLGEGDEHDDEDDNDDEGRHKRKGDDDVKWW